MGYSFNLLENRKFQLTDTAPHTPFFFRICSSIQVCRFAFGTMNLLPIRTEGKPFSCISSYALEREIPSSAATSIAERNIGSSSYDLITDDFITSRPFIFYVIISALKKRRKKRYASVAEHDEKSQEELVLSLSSDFYVCPNATDTYL